MSNSSSITCTVPPTTASENIQATVVVTDGSNSFTAATQFTYNVTNTSSISSVTPDFLTTAGGQLNITGTDFGTDSVSVFVGSVQATVTSISSTEILALSPPLAPGIYPIKVSTTNGYARPLMQIEYRFYVYTISPQVGSLYGGTDVYIQGGGFDGSSLVTFTDDDSNNVPCNVLSVESNQIHCRTTAAVPRVMITSDGIDPTYGLGFAWSPQYATVQQGTVVQWVWETSALLLTRTYKVQQVANGYDTTPLSGGFDSGTATSSGKKIRKYRMPLFIVFTIGSFSYQFQTLGTYYYWSPAVDSSNQISIRGMITVVSAQPQTLTAKVTSGAFIGKFSILSSKYLSFDR